MDVADKALKKAANAFAHSLRDKKTKQEKMLTNCNGETGME